MTDWMLDELAYAGSEHLDPGFVAGYDRKQGRPDPTPDLDALEAHGVGPSSTVLDVAAGTGQFTLAAARRFGRVIALDVSPVMLTVLRDRVAGEGLTNVDCVHAGFLSYDHDGPPVDAVHTRNALHQLPDLESARTRPARARAASRGRAARPRHRLRLRARRGGRGVRALVRRRG